MITQSTINTSFNGDVEVVIGHRTSTGVEWLTPPVEDGVKWETDRRGSAGKLTFKCYSDKDNNVNFAEGDTVELRYRHHTKGWIIVFNGYVFTKKRKKDGWIDVTAYDQLRYLKNKATYKYTNKKASDVIKMISNDYGYPLGDVENTSYVIGERLEDDQSCFDIIQNALDLTLISTKDIYVLYADQGKIHLKNALNMYTDVVINESTAEDFEYSSSIDKETYNEVELYYDNDKTNKREYFNARSKSAVNQWGLLRYTESLSTHGNAQDKATQMLKLYNRPTQELKVSGAFGDCDCRGGASVVVNLNLGDTTVNNYMLIEKATHTFKSGEYRMDLELSGFGDNTTFSSDVVSKNNVPAKTLKIRTAGDGGFVRLTYQNKDGNEQVTKLISDGKLGFKEISVFADEVVTVEIVTLVNYNPLVTTTWEGYGTWNKSSATTPETIEENRPDGTRVYHLCETHTYTATADKDLKIDIGWMKVK